MPLKTSAVKKTDGLILSPAGTSTVEFREIYTLPMPDTEGDFNGNRELDTADINMLAWAAANTNNLSFDLTIDRIVDAKDVAYWIKDLYNSWIGDSNLDREFNSADLISVFAAGNYELDKESSWSQGDWTGDLRFDSADLVAAFTDDGYEQGPRPEMNAVPEPILLFCLSVLLAFRWIIAGRYDSKLKNCYANFS